MLFSEHAMLMCVCHADNCRHSCALERVGAVRTDESNARVDARIKAVAKALEQITAPSRKFSVVTAWEDSFLKLDHRWKILILCADSRAGKSNYAEGLFDTPFVITVEDADYLDLKGFDFEKNDGIVLDNVNSWGQLLKWRAVLQARNAKSKGGPECYQLPRLRPVPVQRSGGCHCGLGRA